MTDAEYQRSEITRASGDIAALSHHNLGDRQAARAAYADALVSDLPRVVRTLEWLADGTYGAGPWLLTAEVLTADGRRNKAAGLSVLVAGFEWGCPPRFTAQAYLGLTPAQRAAVDEVFADAIARLTATTDED
jgi:hypothetical protein